MGCLLRLNILIYFTVIALLSVSVGSAEWFWQKKQSISISFLAATYLKCPFLLRVDLLRMLGREFRRACTPFITQTVQLQCPCWEGLARLPQLLTQVTFRVLKFVQQCAVLVLPKSNGKENSQHRLQRRNTVKQDYLTGTDRMRNFFWI